MIGEEKSGYHSENGPVFCPQSPLNFLRLDHRFFCFFLPSIPFGQFPPFERRSFLARRESSAKGTGNEARRENKREPPKKNIHKTHRRFTLSKGIAGGIVTVAAEKYPSGRRGQSRKLIVGPCSSQGSNPCFSASYRSESHLPMVAFSSL